METAQSVNVEKTNQVVKLAYLISGFVFVFLGVLGAFLPLLPTTIFLILASACFMKSSPRANAWLKNNKLLGSYLRNYQDKTGLTIASKITHIAVLWIGILISAYLLTDKTATQVLLFMIAVGVTVHLVMIKTAR
jgi:uncharacterized membrane protein YbaN (DUF454 family)